MKKTALLLILIILPFASLFAQDVPPALFETIYEKPMRIEMTALDVDVKIHGYMTETRMTMTFYNPSNRNIAGDLYFPLPEDSVVSGYALDINGVMVDGVPVEKQKARQVFEKIVRQGIDPGLVQWTQGNTFKTRVFPIPPGGTRTIMVRYTGHILEKNDKAAYYLPFNYERKIDDFHLRIEVIRPDAPPRVEGEWISPVTFRKWNSSFVAETRLTDTLLTRDIYIALPSWERNPVFLERSPRENGNGSSTYFTISDAVTPPRMQQKLPVPERVALYWDASGSRGTTEHSLRLIEYYFSRFQGHEINVDVTLFRNTPDKTRKFLVRNGNTSELISFLDNSHYDGGTSMENLPVPESTADIALMFTDGLLNVGNREMPELGVPLYLYSEDTSADFHFLRYLAAKNRGVYTNLKDFGPADLRRVAADIGRPVFGLIAARVISGSVKEIYPARFQPVSENVRVSGKLESPMAEIVMQYGTSGGVETEHFYTLYRSDAEEGELVPLAWAGQKLSELMVSPDRNRALITDLGKEFGIVTPGTSLLVLDNLEQYVENRIPPPKSLPVMRTSYFERIAELNNQKQQSQERKIDRIVSLWNERVEWWRSEFSYPEDFRIAEGGNDENGDTAEEPAMTGAMDEMLHEEEMESSAMPSFDRGGADDFAASEASGRSAAEADMEKKEAADKDSGSGQEEIVLKPWDPDTPYLEELKAVHPSDAYTVYIRLKNENLSSPAFFLDCADFFISAGMPRIGLRVLTNLAELELENAALLRVMGHRLSQLGYSELAVPVFEKVLEIRPEEPQSWRDLGLVLAAAGNYSRAIPLLYRVITGEWERFDGIEIIALMELNNMIRKSGEEETAYVQIDPRLVALLDVDIRIMLTWDTDLTDMDLWVIEPSGEKAYYGNRDTRIGGHVSRDFTEGYGPEEYTIRRAMSGTYQVKVNYYSSSAPALTGAVTLQVDIFTNYGRLNEEKKSITVRLRESEEVLNIGDVVFGER